MRLRHGLILCALMAGCSRADSGQSLVFETGDEFGAEVVLGDRSLLPACSGEGFCSNAVTFFGVLDGGDDHDTVGVVLSPRGDQVVDLEAGHIGRVSPSGNWLLLAEPNGSNGQSFARLGVDGSRVELGDAFTRIEWVAGDWLIARAEGEVHILDADGALIETIADAPGDLRFHDISENRDRLLFVETESPPGSNRETSLWVYERSTSSWSQLDHGVGFVLNSSHPGFGPDDSSVIVQVDHSEVTNGVFESFDYRIEAIDIRSGEITLIEASTGAGLQFSSVAPDGRTVAVRGSNMIRVVDVASGRSSPFVQVGGHGGGSPTWSWDGRLIGSGSSTVLAVSPGRDPQLSLPIDVTPERFLYAIVASLGTS